MSILFHEIVFGPISSRRFGQSLGINVLPLDNKVCNFNCIYCECGWTDLHQQKPSYFSYEIIATAIQERFQQIKAQQIPIDSITFAGNGEPTMHPQFLTIMDATIRCRNAYLPGVKIVVLSNATLLGNKHVAEALKKADVRVLKLDAGTDELLNLIDQPLTRKDIDWYVQKLQEFGGDIVIQTMFLKGQYQGASVDNTTDDEVTQWLEKLKVIQPKSVMIYTIDRATPAEGLERISSTVLGQIKDKVQAMGIPAEVYF